MSDVEIVVTVDYIVCSNVLYVVRWLYHPSPYYYSCLVADLQYTGHDQHRCRRHRCNRRSVSVAAKHGHLSYRGGAHIVRFGSKMFRKSARLHMLPLSGI